MSVLCVGKYIGIAFIQESWENDYALTTHYMLEDVLTKAFEVFPPMTWCLFGSDGKSSKPIYHSCCVLYAERPNFGPNTLRKFYIPNFQTMYGCL